MDPRLLTLLACVGVCWGMKSPSGVVPPSPAALAAVTSNGGNNLGTIQVVDSVGTAQQPSTQTGGFPPGAQATQYPGQTPSTSQMTQGQGQMPGQMGQTMGQMGQMGQLGQMSQMSPQQQALFRQRYLSMLEQRQAMLASQSTNSGGPFQAFTASMGAAGASGTPGTQTNNIGGMGQMPTANKGGQAFRTQAKKYVNDVSMTMARFGRDGLENIGRSLSLRNPLQFRMKLFEYPSYTLLPSLQQSDPKSYQNAVNYLQQVAAFDRAGNEAMAGLLAQRAMASNDPVTSLMAKVDIAAGRLGFSDNFQRAVRFSLAKEYGPQVALGFGM